MWFRQKYIDYLGSKFLPLRRKLATYGLPNPENDPYAEVRHKYKTKLGKLLKKYNTLIDKQMEDRKASGKKEIVPGVYWNG